MKNAILIITLCMGLAACSSSSTKNNSGDSSATKPAATNATAEPKGAALMAAADCNTCHKPDMKVVGPSFKDIAGKYTEADVDKLADKVIKGGGGVWGEVPMTPHASISKDDAKEMIKYILTQK
ncbi:MAG: c-type cytochrome [Bacteroidota bacterium]